MPLCFLYFRSSTTCEAPDELTVVYQSERPCREPAGAADASRAPTMSCSRRRRGRPRATTTTAIPSAPALHPEIMDRGRPHGSREESGLLEQGPSLSRPHRPETVAGRAVALRQPAIGRSRYCLGRRIRRRQYPEGAERSEDDGSHLCRLRRRGLRLQHQGRRRSTTCACARRW